MNTIVQTRHPVIVFNGDPEFELTFEEDFRIHELLVSCFSRRNLFQYLAQSIAIDQILNPGEKRQCPWLILQPPLRNAQVPRGVLFIAFIFCPSPWPEAIIRGGQKGEHFYRQYNLTIVCRCSWISLVCATTLNSFQCHVIGSTMWSALPKWSARQISSKKF